MNTKITAPLAILATGAALFVAGCGDDEKDTAATPADTAAQTSMSSDKMSDDKTTRCRATRRPSRLAAR